MNALAEFGDGQWAQALAAVLVGLVLVGGAVQRLGPVAIPGPFAPVWELAGRAGCMFLGAPRAGAAAIMPPRQGGSR